MDESMYTDPELQILTERCRTYQGTAKVNITQITPYPSVSQYTNTKNMERLCEIFDKEGCRRLDIYNHVSAVVSQHRVATRTSISLLVLYSAFMANID
ncbi:hypothetical protein PENSOL_c017G09407 [Penicillium solitum]|uniref:Uncharacterized protein n=1 Tax=Penicillium solitum TaxID=60172 RepID=A0A1V6R3I1_9EURO|nr:uncharacterized protein PENSOL_c017G09407 [Penicillium solitum]OQD96013.1 hypothetical protein PENSOL_c017G09407 [Penicillium solitum]